MATEQVAAVMFLHELVHCLTGVGRQHQLTDASRPCVLFFDEFEVAKERGDTPDPPGSPSP
ncbi:MAG: hypothetical protein ACRDNZ_24130 [Streptosporangiaceae bacterium]